MIAAARWTRARQLSWSFSKRTRSLRKRLNQRCAASTTRRACLRGWAAMGFGVFADASVVAPLSDGIKHRVARETAAGEQVNPAVASRPAGMLVVPTSLLLGSSRSGENARKKSVPQRPWSARTWGAPSVAAGAAPSG